MGIIDRLEHVEVHPNLGLGKSLHVWIVARLSRSPASGSMRLDGRSLAA